MIVLLTAENRTSIYLFIWTKHRNVTERQTDGPTVDPRRVADEQHLYIARDNSLSHSSLNRLGSITVFTACRVSSRFTGRYTCRELPSRSRQFDLRGPRAVGPAACVFGQPAVELIVSERTHVSSRVMDV